MVEKFSRTVRLRHGKLKRVGYDPTESDAQSRRAALRDAVDRYGWQSVVKSLTLVGNYTKNTQPTHSERYHADAHWVEREFGEG